MDKKDIIIGLQAVTLLLVGYLAFSGGGSSSSSVQESRNIVNQARTNAAPNMQPGITPTNTANNPASAQVTVDPANATTMSFQEMKYDFGTVQEGEKVTRKFKFKNTGDKPLTIQNAKGSCGCTVPTWPRTPIAPGAENEIEVVFDSKGKPGKQTKTVTITANTSPSPTTTLTITGEVIKQ